MADINSRQIGFRLIGDNGAAIEARATDADLLKPGTWNVFVATYDGSRNQSGLMLYLNGRPVVPQGLGARNARLNGCIETEDRSSWAARSPAAPSPISASSTASSPKPKPACSATGPLPPPRSPTHRGSHPRRAPEPARLVPHCVPTNLIANSPPNSTASISTSAKSRAAAPRRW